MYLYKYIIRELCLDGINLPFAGTSGGGALIPTIKALSILCTVNYYYMK